MKLEDHHFTLLATAVLVLLSGCATHNVSNATDAYLRRQFGDRSARIRYAPGVSDPAPVEQPVLRRVLPGTSFFRATLLTQEFEYRNLKVLVASTQTGKGFIFVHCFSPTWTDASPEFLALFRQATAASFGEREQVARAIAELFATITFEGRVGAVQSSSDGVRVELWHGRLHWRDVTVSFTSTNFIEHVRVTNPDLLTTEHTE